MGVKKLNTISGRVQAVFLRSLKGEIGPFTVVYSVTRPMNGSEAAGDLELIQTSLLLSCKSCIRLHLHKKTKDVCIKTRSPAASLPFIGRVTAFTGWKRAAFLHFKIILCKQQFFFGFDFCYT